jgi:phosphatidylglycerophosphatase A
MKFLQRTDSEPKDIKQRLAVLFATGFGLGLSPVASGSVGSLLGVAIAVAMGGLTVMCQAVVCAVLSVVAMPICGAAEDFYGKKDDGRIVADEFMTFPICLLGLPWGMHPWLLAVAFVVNRLMDIAKFPPAYQAQNLVGGVGIVMDDVISSLYALGINHAIWYMLSQ